jgi:UDP-N-acetylglucosamine--N-acetylmuramyl-(pentapeptide) pyrophosphoryl-undecaprenol N-acetylglucosamine transferase
VLLPQPQLAPGTLAALLRRMDRATLLEMARKARALGKPDAARTVAERCMELAR